MLPGETANLATVTVDGGGTVAMGNGVTFTSAGVITINSGVAIVNCSPGATGNINVYNGSTLIVGGTGLTIATITATNGSTISWLSDNTLTTLVLKSGAVFDKSGDVRGMTLTNSTIDADTCIINDPNNTISFTNATATNNQCTTGPFHFGQGRTVKLT
jgi:hypothetical protein